MRNSIASLCFNLLFMHANLEKGTLRLKKLFNYAKYIKNTFELNNKTRGNLFP